MNKLERIKARIASVGAELKKIADEEPGVPLRYRDPQTQQTALALSSLISQLERSKRHYEGDSKATPCGTPQ